MELEVGVFQDSLPTNVAQMQRHIHLEQVKRICGWHHSPKADIAERKRLVQRYCALYDHGNILCLNQNKQPRSDFCPSDPYALLACHILFQIWEETSQAAWLYK